MPDAANAATRRAVSSTDTVHRILDGALAAIARRGLAKVSMSDIGESAGVSRGTLYRYFASKDEVLHALPDFLQLRWERDLRAAVAQRPAPAERLRVVMDTMIGYADHSPDLLRLIRAEPDFGLHLLERNLPESVKVVADLLEPVIEEAAVVHQRVITGPELAEMMFRIAMSGFLVPATRTRQLGKRVANFWDFVNEAQQHTMEPERMAGVAQMPRARRHRGA